MLAMFVKPWTRHQCGQTLSFIQYELSEPRKYQDMKDSVMPGMCKRLHLGWVLFFRCISRKPDHLQKMAKHISEYSTTYIMSLWSQMSGVRSPILTFFSQRSEHCVLPFTAERDLNWSLHLSLLEIKGSRVLNVFFGKQNVKNELSN